MNSHHLRITTQPVSVKSLTGVGIRALAHLHPQRLFPHRDSEASYTLYCVVILHDDAVLLKGQQIPRAVAALRPPSMQCSKIHWSHATGALVVSLETNSFSTGAIRRNGLVERPGRTIVQFPGKEGVDRIQIAARAAGQSWEPGPSE